VTPLEVTTERKRRRVRLDDIPRVSTREQPTPGFDRADDEILVYTYGLMQDTMRQVRRYMEVGWAYAILENTGYGPGTVILLKYAICEDDEEV